VGQELILKRSRLPSPFWAFLFRHKLVRARMPFWRVVVEAKPNAEARAWPADLGAVVGAVFVWARTIEEAEGLAQLAVEAEGLEPLTADAMRVPPAARPQGAPATAGIGEWGFLPRPGQDAAAGSRRDARA
jgi:hypothetical protein